MLGLQAAIGALNDAVDAPRDAGLKQGKPIPAGLVTRREAVLVAAAAALAGLALTVPSGAGPLVVALAILAVGGLYDLALKGTAWSWLPFAVGIPLLPVFAWLGAGSPLPAAFRLLIPAGALAGAALAIGNAMVDVERDRAAGITSIAARLGRVSARRTMALLYATVLVAALASSPVATAPALAIAVVAVAAVVIAAGVVLAGAASPAARERGWQLQVIAVAVLAAGWLGSAVLE
jgi:4-hydroxybenzoate polyprenyltransferase